MKTKQSQGSVVYLVITRVSHTRGTQFDPGRSHFCSLFFGFSVNGFLCHKWSLLENGSSFFCECSPLPSSCLCLPHAQSSYAVQVDALLLATSITHVFGIHHQVKTLSGAAIRVAIAGCDKLDKTNERCLHCLSETVHKQKEANILRCQQCITAACVVFGLASNK